jgi:flavorubredoxin
MWGGTALLADALKQGLWDKADVKVMRASTTDKSDIITEVFRSKIVLFGSPTVNAGILSSMAAILEQVKGMKFKNKKSASFGCFGWSGESIEIMNSLIKEAGLELINNGYSCLWEPDRDMLKRAEDFGGELIK